MLRGRKLLVLDELVLNVASFINHHQNGQFVLKQNIGRDFSKFFRGRNGLEGNLGPKPALSYEHSNHAHRIVNSLIKVQFKKENVF